MKKLLALILIILVSSSVFAVDRWANAGTIDIPDSQSRISTNINKKNKLC